MKWGTPDHTRRPRAHARRPPTLAQLKALAHLNGGVLLGANPHGHEFDIETPEWRLNIQSENRTGKPASFASSSLKPEKEPGPIHKPAIVVQIAGLDADPEFFKVLQDALKDHIARICELPGDVKWTVQKVGGEWAS